MSPTQDVESQTDPAPSPNQGRQELRRERELRWGLALIFVALTALVIAIFAWIFNASVVDHWLAVHTGTVNESGPYYGFWSGFGSDIAEFGLIGVLATAAYQLVKKYNCHEPGCWRIGNHPAAGGRFNLCYLHHPDYQGKKPTHEMIVRLHGENAERERAIHERLVAIEDHLSKRTASGGAAPTGDGGATSGGGSLR
jgi:hypothetical protein